MSAGRGATSVAVAVAALLPLLAGAGYEEDCYDSCFKDCIAKDKSMRDFCSYACDLRCSPDEEEPDEPPLPQPKAAALAGGLRVNCQLACVRTSCLHLREDGEDMEACSGRCYDSCKTKAALPRPLRAFRPAALPDDHRFHNKQGGAVRPAAPLPDDHPFHKEERAVWPAALPDHKKQGAALRERDHPFRKMQDAGDPSTQLDPDDVIGPAWIDPPLTVAGERR